MKNPVLKSIIRRPIKFVLLILIISLISGAFIMNIASYALVSEEVELAKEAYKSIGYIQLDFSKENNNGNVYGIRNLIKDDPMIDYEDYNIFTLGISDNLLNSGYNVITESYNEQSTDIHLVVRDLFIIVKPKNIRTIIPAKDRYDGVTLESYVQELLGGYPDWIYNPNGEFLKGGFFKVAAPKYDEITTDLIPYMDDIIIDELYGLEIGDNYLFRCEPSRIAEDSYLIKPLYDGGPLYEKIDNIDEFNLEDPKWQKMREDMELLYNNTRSFIMITSKNMETILNTQESMGSNGLLSGRWINYDDYESNNKVCVVGRHLFEVRRLKLGDMIPIQYIESEFPYYLMTEKDRKEWKSYHKSDVVEYEIVGVYNDYNNGRNLYVPTSTVPEEFMKFPSENGTPYLFGPNYNFVLKNPAEQSHFIQKYENIIKENGFELQFIENNAENFWVSTNKVLSNLKINILLYGFLFLFAMLFTTYMYMEMYKNNYVIERILGATHKSASGHLLIPLCSFVTLGVGLSSYIGYENAIRNSQNILEEILGELPDNLDASISVKFIFLVFLIIIGLLMFQALLRVYKLKGQSLLEFFSKDKKDKAQVLVVTDLDIVDNEFHGDDLPHLLSFDYLSTNISQGKIALWEYGKKYTSRSIATTVLMIVITGLLIGSLTWLSSVIESNKAFIEKTISETTIFGELQNFQEIKSSDRDGISEDILNRILQTNLVGDYFAVILNEYNELNVDRYGIKETIRKEKDLNLAYYEKNTNMTILASNKDINSDDGIKLYGIEDQSIIDELNSYNSMKDEIPILASTMAMNTYNLEIGHKIALKQWGSIYQDVYGTIVGTFERYEFPIYGDTQIQGISVASRREIFIYPIDAVRMIGSSRLSYNEVHLLFDKEKNTELYYNREEILNQVAKNKYGYSTGYKLVLRDKILTESIEPLEKNLELLNIIYPIVLGLSFIIAIALPYLLILKRSEELAIMRILGVKETEVRGYVFKESLLLIIMGEVIAVAIISVLAFKSEVYPIWKYLFAIVGYLLASIIGALAGLKNVLYRKPLDMLQVKE